MNKAENLKNEIELYLRDYFTRLNSKYETNPEMYSYFIYTSLVSSASIFVSLMNNFSEILNDENFKLIKKELLKNITHELNEIENARGK